MSIENNAVQTHSDRSFAQAASERTSNLAVAGQGVVKGNIAVAIIAGVGTLCLLGISSIFALMIPSQESEVPSVK